MAKRNHIEESLHCLMINVLVDSYEKQGYAVFADHVGGLKAMPEQIGRHIPDVVAKKGDEVHIVEVETQGTLESPEAEQEILDFAASAPTKLYLAVPFDCVEMARNLRQNLTAEFEILPCYPFVGYVGVPR